MSERARFPLVARMMTWLAVYLLVLGGAFLVFLNWQLGRGLDSILSGAAAERLEGLGGAVAYELRTSPETEWAEIVRRQVDPYGVDPALLMGGGDPAFEPGFEIPHKVLERLREMTRRVPGARAERVPPVGPEGFPPGPEGPPPPFGREDFPDRERPAGPPERERRRETGSPEPHALFLVREAGAYWAAVDLPLFEPRREQPRHGILLLRSSTISAGGLFFDVHPWIFGGLAVLGLSLVIWAPFAVGISRFVGRLSRTTEAIARGNFEARVGAGRSDELGSLGRSIEQMAGRLDYLVRGQKRFLGDVAHELCAPLARLRTGLGVLEHGIGEEQKDRLASIEEDAEELSSLIAEVLAFTKASTAPGSARLEAVELIPLINETVARECPGQAVTLKVPEGTRVSADRGLLSRVLANLVRNAHYHGGAECRITFSARPRGERVEVIVADDGPGVAGDAIEHLFEPFYRPDSARTRERGGAGLGMAIVRSGVEACGGSVTAFAVDPHGLGVRMELAEAPH